MLKNKTMDIIFVSFGGYSKMVEEKFSELKKSNQNLKRIHGISDIEKVEEFFKEQRAEKRSKWCSDCHCTQVYNKFI